MKDNSFNLDWYVNNKELNILKAVFPHLPANIQKFMAIYIAMKELSNIFALLNAVNSHRFDTPANNDSKLDISKILEAVKSHLDPSETEMIENYINMMNMMKMMNEMSDMTDGTSSDSDSSSAGGFNMDMLKGMLTPEQSAIFDSLSNNI